MARWRNGRRWRLRTSCPERAWEFNSPPGHSEAAVGRAVPTGAIRVRWAQPTLRGRQHAGWTGVWFPARSHKPYDAGSNPAPATDSLRMGQRSTEPHELGCQVQLLDPRLDGRVRKQGKRPGREPGDCLRVQLPPRLLERPRALRDRPTELTYAVREEPVPPPKGGGLPRSSGREATRTAKKPKGGPRSSHPLKSV